MTKEKDEERFNRFCITEYYRDIRKRFWKLLDSEKDVSFSDCEDVGEKPAYSEQKEKNVPSEKSKEVDD